MLSTCNYLYVILTSTYPLHTHICDFTFELLIQCLKCVQWEALCCSPLCCRTKQMHCTWNHAAPFWLMIIEVLCLCHFYLPPHQSTWNCPVLIYAFVSTAFLKFVLVRLSSILFNSYSTFSLEMFVELTWVKPIFFLLFTAWSCETGQGSIK